MTILFDFGGVLCDLDKARCFAAFDQIGFDIRPYLDTYHQKGPFQEIERGEITVHELCDTLRADTPGFTADDETICRAWSTFLVGIPPERLELILKIRKHYPVSLLSNIGPVHWQVARDHFFTYNGHTVNDFFDHIFLSYELGIEKPHPALYRHVVKTLGVPAGDILFLDDAEDNCEGARRCGLQARLAPALGTWTQYFDADGKLLAD